MTPVGHHPLVGQLLLSVGASETEAPSLETWRDLLARMSQMYYETDQDRDELESSIESSSREMQRLYQELKQKAEAERAEQDAILRATLESAYDGIMVVDNQHGVGKAVEALRKGCSAGSTAACNNLAVIEASVPFTLRQEQGTSLLRLACPLHRQGSSRPLRLEHDPPRGCPRSRR